MDEWLGGAKPFAPSDQLAKKHQEIQESAANHLKSNLKGPNEFTAPSMIQFQQVWHIIAISFLKRLNDYIIYIRSLRKTIIWPSLFPEMRATRGRKMIVWLKSNSRKI